MRDHFFGRTPLLRRNIVFSVIVLVAIIVLAMQPTGFERSMFGEAVRARVVAADNTGVRQHGIVRVGDQRLTVELLNGVNAGQTVEAVNHLFGKLELDKMYVPGDTAMALVDADSGEILKVTLQDHYRLHVELILFGLFALLILSYAGFTGISSLLSFVFSAVTIWKVLLPGLLRGWDPILTSLSITALLCFVIIFLVSGFDKKGLVAFCGSMAGMLFTCALSLGFGKLFSIHGAVKPFSETLLYSGFGHLDLTAFFLGGIFLASSGAVMDLSMDISAAMYELKTKRPDISRRELIRSGNTIGRMVVGTMITTLLLAYTGSFTSMLMVFIAQGTPVPTMLNLQYVAAEILHTLVGSFGLVAVAPFTTLLGGLIFVPLKKKAARTSSNPLTQTTSVSFFQGVHYNGNKS